MSSATISTITYPCPPPTTNTLDSQQRMRLMRSARKLEALMGTTPYFVEADIPLTLEGKKKSPTLKALKRQGSIFTHRDYHTNSLSVTSFSSVSTTSLHSPSASLVSLPSSMQNKESLPVTPPGLPVRGRKSADKPRPLYLRMNVAPIDQRCASLPPTPSSAHVTSACFPPTPRSPSFDAAEVRRKRIAKLARHLGESVPPELVTAQAPPSQSREGLSNRKRRSMSVNCANPQNIPFAPRAQVPSQTNSDWVGEWNRPDISDVQRELRALKVAWR